MRSATALAVIGLAGAPALASQRGWRPRAPMSALTSGSSVTRFTKPTAIASRHRKPSIFGNVGCQYDYEDDILLSNADKARILAIKKRERAPGCL
jgi:hypothetical protein